jgi:pyruvate carboxylase
MEQMRTDTKALLEAGLDLAEVVRLEPFVESLRSLYAPFDAGLRAPTGDVYRHRIPGGQLSNLKQQAAALGLGDRFEEVADAYVVADELLGGLIKVTPTSKVVGDLALYLLSTGRAPEDIVADPLAADLPGSVLGFLEGDLGTPPFGWPEPLRTRAVTRGLPDRQELNDEQIAALADADRRRSTVTELLLPDPAADFLAVTSAHGEVWRLPSTVFFYGLSPDEEVAIDLEPGKQLLIDLEAVTDPDDRGIRTLWCRVNGQPRPIEVRDRRIDSLRPSREQADTDQPGDVAAPMTGVVSISVDEDVEVAAGDVVAVIEAMKMESRITAPMAGRVTRVVAPSGTKLEPGDLVLEIR